MNDDNNCKLIKEMSTKTKMGTPVFLRRRHQGEVLDLQAETYPISCRCQTETKNRSFPVQVSPLVLKAILALQCLKRLILSILQRETFSLQFRPKINLIVQD